MSMAYSHSSSSRRGHQRFPCRIAALVYKSMLRPRLGEATILDLGMGGARISSLAILQVRENYQLKFSHHDRKLSFDFQVAWKKEGHPSSGGNSYGLVFLLGPRKEEALKILVDSLRVQEKAPGSGLDLKNYWNP